MRRSTVTLLVIFLLIGAFFWFMQQPENPIKNALATATITPSTSTDVLINPNQAPISLISIKDNNGKTVVIEKTKDLWMVNSGTDGPADQNEADAAAGRALDLLIIKKLETTPDPVGTGLDKPAFTISLTLGNGTLFTFDIGNVIATGDGYYAKTSDGSVYILNKNQVDDLTKYFTEPPIKKTAAPASSEISTPNPGAGSVVMNGTPTTAP